MPTQAYKTAYNMETAAFLLCLLSEKVEAMNDRRRNKLLSLKKRIEFLDEQIRMAQERMNVEIEDCRRCAGTGYQGYLKPQICLDCGGSGMVKEGEQ